MEQVKGFCPIGGAARAVDFETRRARESGKRKVGKRTDRRTKFAGESGEDVAGDVERKM